MCAVLISAVGDTDPVRGGYDGPLLHIIRHYHPQKVYIVYTAEMEKRDRNTDCYCIAIRFIDPNCIIEKIYTGIENASDFDGFYEIFGELLNRVEKENTGADILINISSGTPQIKNTLSLEVVAHNVLSRAIQVPTPEGKTNKDLLHYDAYLNNIDDELINLYDNLTDAPNRCIEPALIGVRKNMIKMQVIKMVENWEYKGAYELIQKNAPLFTERLPLLLYHAYYRSMPDETPAETVAKALDMYYDLYPVRSADAKKTCEYLLAANLRKKRGELTDYVLRINTFVEVMLEKEIDKIVGGISKIAKKTRKGIWILDKNRVDIKFPGMMEYLNNQYKGEYHINQGLSFDSYSKLAGYFNINGYEKLIATHEKRNEATHRLESVTDVELAKIGLKANELQMILEKRVIRFYRKEINTSIFTIYEYINELILRELDINP